MWSVPSRRREFSTSRTIQRREPPRELGSSPIGMKNLVARTTSSRRPASASPTISSDTPPEYTSAVSTKLIPASSARWMMRMESARSSLPQGPNIIAPRQSGLTWTPVRPSGRNCMEKSSGVVGLRSGLEAVAAELPGHCRVAVVEEQGSSGVHGGDPAHLVVGELEAEDVDVLGHALGAHGLRDDDDVALDEPAQDDLCDRRAVRRADLAQCCVGEQVVAALCERAPGLDLHTALAHQLLVVRALEVRVRLDLVHRGRNLVVVDEVHQPVGVEVGDSDRPDGALAEELLHRAPGAVVVPERLVDQVQVDMLEAEPLQRPVEAPTGSVLAGVGDPQLRGDEEFVARDAAGGDGAADGLFVDVRGGGVDVAVAGGEGVGDRPLGVLGRDLVDAEAEDRHPDTVVQGDVGDVRGHRSDSLFGMDGAALVDQTPNCQRPARRAAMTPPSMSRSVPVMKPASGPRRKAAAVATSSAVPTRPAAETSIIVR